MLVLVVRLLGLSMLLCVGQGLVCRNIYSRWVLNWPSEFNPLAPCVFREVRGLFPWISTIVTESSCPVLSLSFCPIFCFWENSPKHFKNNDVFFFLVLVTSVLFPFREFRMPSLSFSWSVGTSLEELWRVHGWFFFLLSGIFITLLWKLTLSSGAKYEIVAHILSPLSDISTVSGWRWPVLVNQI